MSEQAFADLAAQFSTWHTHNEGLVYDNSMAEPTGRVLAYLRVSTEEQALSGLGLADQRLVIANEADRRGWAEVEYLSDQGFSARNLARPALNQALDLLRRGHAGVLVVSKLDRLSRSLLDFATLMDRAQREGWELVVLDVAIDTTTPSGALMANVMAAFAEYERRLIGARTSSALQQLKRQGVRLGRPRVMSSDALTRIATQRANGATLAAIAEGLNGDGVATARGGAKWHPSTVKAALRSLELDAASR